MSCPPEIVSATTIPIGGYFTFEIQNSLPISPKREYFLSLSMPYIPVIYTQSSSSLIKQFLFTTPPLWFLSSSIYAVGNI